MQPPESVRRGLHGSVVHDLGLRIGTGALQPDERIDREQLAERYGVSRTVLREALRVLESKGMVAGLPRRGTRVLPVEEWDVLDRDVIRWRVQGPGRNDQLRDLLALRAGLEPIAARECSRQAGADDIAALLSHCDDMEAAVRDEDLAAFTQADIAFHDRLLMASGNLAVRRLSGVIESVLYTREELNLLPQRVEAPAVAGHRAIALAIQAHDSRGAEQAARTLIDTAGDEIEALLDASLRLVG